MAAKGERGAGAPVRWGVLGTARIATRLIEGVRDGVPDAEVVAVASRDAAAARAYAEAHGVPRAVHGYDALLADPGIDAVYIALPNGLHHAWTLRALEAGKHVLCEKPYSRHAREAEEAFALAEERGLVLSEAFMWRHNPQTRLLEQALAEIGPVESVHAAFGFVLSDHMNHRLDERDGGSLMDVGCYCVSGARLVAGGEPERAFASATPSSRGVDLRMAGTLLFGNGCTATFACSFSARHQGLWVAGAGGTVHVPDPWHCQAGVVVVNGEERRVAPESSFALEVADVSAAIRGERPPLLGRADAVGQARTLEALYRSAATGEVVSVGA